MRALAWFLFDVFICLSVWDTKVTITLLTKYPDKYREANPLMRRVVKSKTLAIVCELAGFLILLLALLIIPIEVNVILLAFGVLLRGYVCWHNFSLLKKNLREG